MRHHPLCPIEALALAFESDPMPNREGPAFWFATNGKWQPLLYGAFLNRFKIMLRQLDMDPRAFAAHSFRRGGGGGGGGGLVGLRLWSSSRDDQTAGRLEELRVPRILGYPHGIEVLCHYSLREPVTLSPLTTPTLPWDSPVPLGLPH